MLKAKIISPMLFPVSKKKKKRKYENNNKKIGAVAGLYGSDPDIWIALQDPEQCDSPCMGRTQGLPEAGQR